MDSTYYNIEGIQYIGTLTGTKFDPCALFELTFLIMFYFIYHILFLVN
jgi:hypothetical protein